MAAGDLVQEVVVTADGGSHLSSGASSQCLRRRWAEGYSYGSRDYNDDEDPWALPAFREDQNGIDDATTWSDRPTKEKLKRLLKAAAKALSLLALLFTFACTLDLMGSAFRLMGGRSAGQVFRDSKLFKNPVVGLMIGVLATATLQSSSTSTSIVVTMVGSKLLTVRDAIPVVMGANIGTSVTNTLVALGQSSERQVFRRAFAAATLHDMFNWLAVIVLLPVEVTTGYLEKLTLVIVQGSHPHTRRIEDESVENGTEVLEVERRKNAANLNFITKPFTSLIIQLDKKFIEDLATGKTNETGRSFMRNCSHNVTASSPTNCVYLLQYLGFSDEVTGCVLLAIAMILLVGCLSLLVRLLKSVVKGQVAFVVSRLFNAEPPFPLNYVAGYAAMAIGCMITIIVQSSSVFTSLLTPLAGIGLIALDRIYPLTLGANLGTTATSVLAAFAAPADTLYDSLRVALCHMFFNISGIILFFPIPCTRVPITLCKLLGSTVAKYRWFAFVYLLGMFFVLPAGVFALSTLGSVVFLAVVVPLMCLLLLIILINIVQKKRPSMLPFALRDWSFLPLWMRSLDPLDRLISRMYCFRRCPGSFERRDGRTLGNAMPTRSRMNILEPSSASGSALSLASATGGPSPQYYQAVKGFEECAFSSPIYPTHYQNNNNNFEDDDFSKSHPTKTSGML